MSALLPVLLVALVLVLAVGCGAVLGHRHARRGEPSDVALRRHLAVARRREEPAAVLALRTDRLHRAGLEGLMRVSDSVLRHRTRTGTELLAVLDGRGLDRAAVEARLRRTLPCETEIGWAAFPADAATFDALIEVARARATHPGPAPARPSPTPRRR